MKRTFWILVVFVYLLPIVFYASVFGIGIWKSHDDWAKMGSALGGIYSPLIAFTTLLLLFRQQQFNEESHKQKMDADFIRDANSKCESYITLAGAQCAKIEKTKLVEFQGLLELYVSLDTEDKRFNVLMKLNTHFRPQLTSLARAGSTIHHMRKSKVDLTGQVSDLRMYAASLIDIDLLLSYDQFHRFYQNDDSYYSFEPSPDEIERIDSEYQKNKS
ncbi:hypothetical protein F3J37_11755 [Pantoea sp. Al-1710]|uniref:Phage abortive infection protein n=1 Tax=Candidatus Pantoea communis TaxID=2608354 RepID=A0ABX0RRX3_9GAMM|nr:hypothetical protein [Pantoea communis]NIG19346.1 hypothetical protein [Pantoea communis]